MPSLSEECSVSRNLRLLIYQGLIALIGTILILASGCSGGSGSGAVSVTPSPTYFVMAYTDGQDPQSYTNLQSFHQNLNAVALGSAYGLLSDGTLDLTGLTPTTSSIISFSKSNNLPVYATVSDYSNAIGGFDPNIILTVAATAASRNNAAANLVNLAVNNGFSGIDLDIEKVGMEAGGPTTQDTSNFTAFVTVLADALHAKGLNLIESIPPSNGSPSFSWLSGYNYAALGAVVDYLQVMTYDEAGPGWSSSPSGMWPGPVSGLDWMNGIIAYMVTQVPSNKILLGLPTYAYDFSSGNQVTWAPDVNRSSLGFNGFIAANKATTYFDASSSTPYATWGTVIPQVGSFSSQTAQPAIWYDTPASITAKTNLVSKYKLGGTGVWAMGYEDASFWAALNAGL